MNLRPLARLTLFSLAVGIALALLAVGSHAQDREDLDEWTVDDLGDFLGERTPELVELWEHVLAEEPGAEEHIADEAREMIEGYFEREEHHGEDHATAWLQSEALERVCEAIAEELRWLRREGEREEAAMLEDRLRGYLKRMAGLSRQLLEGEIKEIEKDLEGVKEELAELENGGERFVEERLSDLLEQEEDEGEEEHEEDGDEQREARADPFEDRGAVISLAELDAHPEPAAIKGEAMRILEDSCVGCHDAESKKGDLDLEAALAELPMVRNEELWKNVVARLQNKDMPPEGKEAPTDQEYRTAAIWVHAELRDFDYSTVDDPGHESAKRLTHREYGNTLSDLLGIEIDVTANFPQDLSGTSGFENSSNSLFIQPLLMERYVTAAEDALDRGFAENPQRILISDDPAEVITEFLARAWRRPVSADELEPFLKRYQSAEAGGSAVEEALKTALRPALLAPAFLLRIESDASGDKPYRIDDWELASRLSYFLWASMPDDELFALAEAGTLHEPEVLRAQVTRMLAQPMAKSLGDTFAAQWLKFADLGTRIRMDPIDNPWCTETLMASMKQETAMFFDSLVAENQPLARMIDADYTFLNQELAEHYRIRGIEGSEMQRIQLQPISRRGGLFAHGSVLAVTSFPGRTSPVVRGNWILSDLLGSPPPPPPPDAGTLEETVGDRRNLSVREQMELHRANPRCAGCHREMDPLGLSLEKFDFFGRRRDDRSIDTKGQMPDGTEFEGLRGLKKVIGEDRIDDLARQTTRKLLSYGLGRQLEYYDELAVRKIIADTQAGGYRLQDLVTGVIQSYPFQWKKNQ